MVFKKTVKKASPVIVETKKHEDASCCNHKGKKCFWILVIILLVLNLAVGVWNSLNSTSARNIEALKVWGKENLELVKKLYEMDNYKQQQKWAIMQVLNSFAGGAQWQQAMPTQQVQPTQPTEQAPQQLPLDTTTQAVTQ